MRASPLFRLVDDAKLRQRLGMSIPESASALITTRAELLRNGYSSSRIDRRLQAKTLGRIHASAYTDLTIARTPVERWFGVLAGLVAGARCEIAVSHRSAAVLHRWDGFNHLGGFDIDSGRYAHRPCDVGGLPVDVTISYRSVLASKAAIRSRTFAPDDSVMMFGLPVTSPARTILDVSEFAPPDLVELALESMLRPESGKRPDEWNRELFDKIVLLSAARDRKKGTATVRRIVADRGPVRPTGSLPETLVVQSLRLLKVDLARQVTIRIFNRKRRIVATFYPDLAALHLGVLIEIDGFIAHATSKQQRSDLERQNMLANFFTIRRYAAADVLKNPGDVARSITRILSAARARPEQFTNAFGRVVLTLDGTDIFSS